MGHGSIQKDSFVSLNTGEYTFILTDGVSTMNVNYNGELPSSLGTEADIVIYGTFRDRTFQCSKDDSPMSYKIPGLRSCSILLPSMT